MKKLTIGVFVLALLASCAPWVGIDGEAYIAYSWAVDPIVFYTEDPAFAGKDFISNGVYENAHVGTWYFEYIAWDASYWYGTYEIYVDEGGPLYHGEDVYFELACYSFGPSFYAWDEDFAFRAVGTTVPPNTTGGGGRQELSAGRYVIVLEYFGGEGQ
jgi:hypothetical protein